MDFISQPWHWSISGAMIGMVMFLLIYFGQKFGVSTSLRAMCSMAGAGKLAEYFKYDWKTHSWLLIFVVGSVIGGYIAGNFMTSPNPVQISEATIADLAKLGISPPGEALVPLDIFNFEFLATPTGLIMIVLGGIFIGFGTRWAGGCTSGHAITGLSNLQLPSLIAVIGFFIGGLIVTFIVYPILFA